MSGLKQILVVDDHFEMLELLRSTLEMAGATGAEYQVLGVPSAEEGFLELQRTPFDLLITDYRLPGMNGLELAARVKRYRPEMPVIMISGYASDDWEEQANALEIYRYFRKPLDTYALLDAVQSALRETAVTPIKTAAADRPAATRDAKRTAQPAAPPYTLRLDTLRADTGARQVLLAQRDGTQLYAGGDPIGADAPPILATIAAGMANSFVLADQLGNSQPLTIHYQAGQYADLYAANIGHDHFLVLLFDAQARRGRIGTVWIFAQRAIGDLLTLLPVASADPLPEVEATPADQPATPAVTQVEEPHSIDDAAIDVPELTWDDGTTAELDAFWDSAIADADDVAGEGLSLEEARRQGLLPPDFGEGDLPGA